MKNSPQTLVRLSAIALLLLTTTTLNACSVKTQAKSTVKATTTQPSGDDCDSLSTTSFEVEAALMGVGMGTEMGFSLVDKDIERAQAGIAKVEALKLKDPKVKALQTQYLKLVKAALKPVEPLAKSKNKEALKGVAKDVKAKIDVANDFRKDQIFFGNCKK